MKKVIALILALALSLTLCACGGTATLQDYVESDAVQSELATLQESLGDTMSIEITATEDTLVYNFTISSDLVVDGMGEALAAELENQASTFGDAAAAIAEEVDIEEPKVQVNYLDSEGNELASRVFTAADASN